MLCSSEIKLFDGTKATKLNKIDFKRISRNWIALSGILNFNLKNKIPFGP